MNSSFLFNTGRQFTMKNSNIGKPNKVNATTTATRWLHISLALSCFHYDYRLCADERFFPPYMYKKIYLFRRPHVLRMFLTYKLIYWLYNQFVRFLWGETIARAVTEHMKNKHRLEYRSSETNKSKQKKNENAARKSALEKHWPEL